MKPAYKIIFIGCLIVAVLMGCGSFLKAYFSGNPYPVGTILIGMGITFTITFLISIVNMNILWHVQKKIAIHEGFIKRLLIELFFTSLSASLIIFIIVIILFNLSFMSELQRDNNFNVVAFNNIVIALLINFAAIITSEAYCFFQNWKNTLLQAEKLKRENSEAQLDALKSQINPHFLFNSLNTLSSLITISPERAKEYIAQFSKVYRFLLNVKDKAVVELKEELDFLNSYVFLQQIRFGKNFSVETKIDSAHLNKLIPVIALQTIIENCVKHNEISNQFPLWVKITNDDKYIYVTNNFQPKQKTETSTGTGINNLKKRYSFFSDLTPEFYIENGRYIAKIPMIEE